MSATPLEVHKFYNAVLVEEVVASPDSFLEAKIPQQGAQVIETNVCVRSSAQYGPHEQIVSTHGTSRDISESWVSDVSMVTLLDRHLEAHTAQLCLARRVRACSIFDQHLQKGFAIPLQFLFADSLQLQQLLWR